MVELGKTLIQIKSTFIKPTLAEIVLSPRIQETPSLFSRNKLSDKLGTDDSTSRFGAF